MVFKLIFFTDTDVQDASCLNFTSGGEDYIDLTSPNTSGGEDYIDLTSPNPSGSNDASVVVNLAD
jgi:hypothetical protein